MIPGRPRQPEQAVTVARSLVGHGVYWMGTGDTDTPAWGRFDCAGFAISRCYQLRRHRPGFNIGPWASISDDLNCNSAIEDADHHHELFVRAARPEPGDLLTYPTFYLPGNPKPFIGHVAIVVDVSRVVEWDPAAPAWSLLGVVQCCGPDGRMPGIVASSAHHWAEHDRVWPKSEHRSSLLRLVP